MDEQTAGTIADFARYISPGKVRFYEALGFTSVPARREGVWIFDTEGRRFMNCRSGEIFTLGHHPEPIVAALRVAIESLDAGDHAILSAPRAALARRLAELMPGDIQYTIFGAAGGEAVDVAIKLARAHTGRPGVISAQWGYHGHTGLALAAGAQEDQTPFAPLAPGFRQVPFGDLAALEQALDESVGAVLLETIPVSAGMLVPPPDYYPAVRRLCDERGAVLICDEVQVGLGRTGRLWAIDEWGVVPDVLVLGKGLGGAMYPISVACYRPHLNGIFERDPFIHLSTYGGADLGCVVAQAVLDQVTSPELRAHVEERSAQLLAGLEQLRQRHPELVREVRGRGLMLGVELAAPQLGLALVVQLARRGVLTFHAFHRPSTLLIKPPLVISAAEVDFLLEALDGALLGIRG